MAVVFMGLNDKAVCILYLIIITLIMPKLKTSLTSFYPQQYHVVTMNTCVPMLFPSTISFI